AIFNLQVVDPFDERHDCKATSAELRPLECWNSVTVFVVVGNEVDVSPVLMPLGRRGAVLLMQRQAGRIRIKRVLRRDISGCELCRASTAGCLDIGRPGRIRVAPWLANATGASTTYNENVRPGTHVRQTTRRIGAIVISLYGERQGRLQGRQI